MKLLRPLVHFVRSFTEEGRVLLAFSLVAGAAGLDVDQHQIYLLWCGLTACLAGGWIAGRWTKLPGVIAEVRGPKRVTLGDVAEVELLVSNTGSSAQGRLRVFGPPLPPGVRYLTRRTELPGLAAGGSGRATIPLCFDRRGDHGLGAFELRALAPLGLGFGPPVGSGGLRVRVVPRLARVTRLATPEGHRYQPGGVALASKTGESMELMGVRPYRPGDPVRDLHARSWARTGVPVVREYQQEYFSRLGVVLDVDRRAADPERFEAAVSLAAGVVAHLSRGEALIDLLVVGDRVHPLTLGRSLGFLEQALDLLACAQPGPAIHAEGLLARLRPYLGRLSCVVMVALAWDDDRRRLAAHIREQGVAVRALWVADPREGELRGEVARVDPAAIRAGAALAL